MSNTTPPPHASSSYAYNYGGRWQGISVEKVINSFLQFLEMDPEKNEVNYDTYGRFHPCYESVADAVYGVKHDANARRNDTKWLDTLWKQNRRKIRTIVLRKALEQNLITREQLEKCRRKALERAAANYDFIDTLPEHAVDSKNRNRAVRHRDTSTKAAAAAKQNGTLQAEAKNNNAVGQFTQQNAPLPRSVGPSISSVCVPVPVERCVKLAIFTSNSLKLGQLLSPFEMPNGTLLVLDNDEVFVFQKAHVNLNLQLALANGSANGPQARVAQPSSSSAGVASMAQTETQAQPQPTPQQTTTRNKRKSKAPQCSTRSKRVLESTEAKDAAGEERTEVGCNEPDTRSSSNSNVTGSPIFSHVNGSPIVSIDDERLVSACVRHVRTARASSVDEDAPPTGVWFDEADVKPLLVAD